MQHIFDSLIGALERGEEVVLGVILQSFGSAPRTSGARMLVTRNGRLYGSIGGGGVEGACHAEAKILLDSSRDFKEITFDLSGEDAAKEGMVCGGTVRVFLHKVGPGELDRFKKLRTSFLKGSRTFIITQLPGDNQSLKLMMLGAGEDERTPRAIQQKALSMAKPFSTMIEHERRHYLIEPLAKPGTVHLAGAGHVALATAKIASIVGLEIVVIDDREEFANSDRFPEAKKIRVVDNFNNCFVKLYPDDYVVIVTRGHQYDLEILAQVLRTEAGYIGMIGSSKKRKAIYKALLSDGFSQKDIDRVYSPIGLDIGSDTPEEIGLSIVAEIVKLKSERNH